jgi:diamine N-acetyltransferase
MNTIKIRKVTISDVGQLIQISRTTFFETFSAGNTEENMQEYLQQEFTNEKLTAELEEKYSEFYFAVLNNDVVGYLKVNLGTAQTELKEDTGLEIERIYVLKEFHGKKVGQLLYEKAIKIATLKGAEFVWLGVWEQNPRAISFYKKNGFIPFDQHIFKFGNEEQTDIMMRRELKSNAAGNI